MGEVFNPGALAENSTAYNCALALLAGVGKVISSLGAAVSSVDVSFRSVAAYEGKPDTSSLSLHLSSRLDDVKGNISSFFDTILPSGPQYRAGLMICASHVFADCDTGSFHAGLGSFRRAT